MIISIDPGNTESAYTIMDKNLKLIEFGKLKNEVVIDILGVQAQLRHHVVIENIASYGMAVGKEVFETCIWIGRFTERSIHMGNIPKYIYRKDEKINLCGTMRAKDSNIIQALKDRFGDKGTVKAPGWFFGFKADIWQAYAVGITYYDLHIKGAQNEVNS